MVAFLILSIIFLAFLGMPLFVTLAGITMVCYHLVSHIEFTLIIEEIYRIANTPVLIALPLFTLAGYFLAESNAPTRLVNFTNALLGWIPGGLTIVVLVACAIFTALTGASGVTIIALGGLLMPALIKEHYPERYALGVLTCCGSLGLLFPPSLPMIIYGIVGQVSIEKLFVAGFIPGVVLITFLAIYGIIVGYRRKTISIPFTLGNLWAAFKDILWESPIPVIILGGIYGGILTATETAAVVAFYVFVVEVFIKRDIPFSKIPAIIREAILVVGAIIIILGSALGFTNFLIDERVPMKLFEFVSTFIKSKITFLLILNVFLLIVGSLMDIFSATVVVAPMIIPIAISYGVDPVHLAIIFLTNLEIGYLTPPVGINLFISSFFFKKPVVELYRAVIPFILILIAALMVITYVPEFSTFLVQYTHAK
ncbi:MAG TPA: TRAP transporter large permease subunit [bacterium]